MKSRELTSVISFTAQTIKPEPVNCRGLHLGRVTMRRDREEECNSTDQPLPESFNFVFGWRFIISKRNI